MVHPAGVDLTRMDVIAVQEVSATYTGRAAHAAAFPHEGRNALDAAVLGYLNVAALRQHIRPTERVHGDHHARRARSRTSSPPALAPSGWSARDSIRSLAPLKERVSRPACGLGRRRRAVRSTSPGRTSSTPTCSTTRSWSTATPPTQATLGRTVVDAGRADGPSWAAPTWATSATSCPRSTR